MAGYETQDPNSLDQVQNQPGFNDQSDDQSNSVGGRGGDQDQLSYAAGGQDQGPVDQSSFAAGGQDQGQLDQSSFAGGQDQSGGDGTGTNDQSGGYSDPSQPAAALMRQIRAVVASELQLLALMISADRNPQ
jgi:hypothetical protein